MLEISEIMTWYLLVQVIGLGVTPFVFYLCKNLHDKGYSITKIFGVVFLTYLSYLLTVTNLFHFGDAIKVSLSIILILSLFLLIYKPTSRRIISNFNDPKLRKVFLKVEIIFLLLFLFFVMVRAYNPDIYGGEMRYDFAYLNTLTRIEKFPPPHTWFGGVSLDNYYYFGLLSAAILTILSGIKSSVTYNLALSTFSALAGIATFGILYNLTKKSFYGILGILLVVFAGNIFSLFQVVNYFEPGIDFYVRFYEPPLYGDFFQKALSYNWWWPSRIIPWAIHEPPYWSFIWGDLHNHFMAIPIRILLGLLLLNIFRSKEKGFRIFGKSLPSIFVRFFAFSISLGFLFPANIYDWPYFALFTMMVIIAHECIKDVKISNLLKGFSISILIILLSLILYLPIDSQLLQHTKLSVFKILPHEENPLLGSRPVQSIQIDTFKTSLYHFTLVYSLQLFLIFSFIFYHFYELLKARGKWVKILSSFLFSTYLLLLISVFLNYFPRMDDFYSPIEVSLTLNSLLYDFQLLILIIPIILGSIYLFFKTSQLNCKFIFILIIFGSLIAFLSELVNVEGRYVTMNKVYGGTFIFWGIASSYILYSLMKKFHFFSKSKSKIKFLLNLIWILTVTFLFLSYLIFPVLSTIQKVNLFKPTFNRESPTLDGADYLGITHKDDYEAIKWINENIKGTPRILEVPGRSYQYTSRVSAFTGLPTVLGWDTHMNLILSINMNYIAERSNEVDQIYDTTDNEKALKLIKKYDVKYIYIGELEKEYKGIYVKGSVPENKEYSKEGLDKFNKFPEFYTLIYNESGVQIYKVESRKF